MIKKITYIIAIGIVGCKNEEQPQSHPQQEKIQSFYAEDAITPDDIKTITPEEAKTFHKDKEFQYEYRTGTSGHYEYNYLVHGNDQNGNQVEGEINIQGKYGAGVISNKEGDDIEINAEWIRPKKLKATDKEGNEYDLEAD